MLLHARALCNCACELLEWAALDVRLLRHPLACSWRSLSTCNTTKAVALSLYKRARRKSSSLGCHCSWFLSRFASLFWDVFRLWRGSAFVSAGSLLSSLPALPLCVSSRRLSRSALVSAIDSTPICFISASATPLARRVSFYIANKYINFICNMYEHFNQLIELASFLACLLTLVLG